MHVLNSIADFVKRTDKLLWTIMLLISTYSLLLLKTIPIDNGYKLYNKIGSSFINRDSL